MPTELLDAIRTIEAGLDRVPVLLIAIVLLTGPTLLWLGYRYFVVMARPPVIGADIDEEGGLFWICERCRSAGELHETHCYHCGLERVETHGALRVVDGEDIVLLEPDDDWGDGDEAGDAPLDVPMVAVGPGSPVFDEEYDAVPVGAIAAAFGEGPAAQNPRRAVVVGASPDAPASDDMDDASTNRASHTNGVSHTNGTNGRNGSH